MPSSSGMAMSVKIKCGRHARAAATASTPVQASTTDRAIAAKFEHFFKHLAHIGAIINQQNDFQHRSIIVLYYL